MTALLFILIFEVLVVRLYFRADRNYIHIAFGRKNSVFYLNIKPHSILTRNGSTYSICVLTSLPRYKLILERIC